MEDYFDLPFFYVYDASVLANGQSYDGLSLAVDRDAEFRLRAVFGINLVCSGGLYFYDGSGRPVTPRGFIHPGSQPLLVQPEIVYPPAGQIRFNLSNVQRAAHNYTGTQKAYYSRLCFYGVKRFTGGRARSMLDQQKSSAEFRHFPYQIRNDLTVNIYSHIPPGFTQEEAPRQLRIEVDNYGYDWFALAGEPDLLANKLLLMPYDSSGTRQLASDFVPSSFLAWRPHRPWACFPSSPLFFPANGILRLDWMSRYTDADTLPAVVPVTLIGARRIGC